VFAGDGQLKILDMCEAIPEESHQAEYQEGEHQPAVKIVRILIDTIQGGLAFGHSDQVPDTEDHVQDR